MLENFIYAKNKRLFKKELEAGNVLNEAIVFIEDTKEIWNHGTFFNGAYIEDLEEIRNNSYSALLPDDINHLETQQHALDTFALKTDVITKISGLEKDINYAQEDYNKNGVYVLNKDNLIIDYRHGDSTCKGVVVILDNIKLLLSKLVFNSGNWKASGDTSLTRFVDNICSTESVDEALLDFLGKHNTKQIFITGGSAFSSDMCNLIYDYNMGVFGNNEGFDDWYIPALGQLYAIFLHLNQINEAFTQIGAKSMSGTYWSSTLATANGAWTIHFSLINTTPAITHKNYVSYEIIAVKDILPISIKEKINILENQHEWSILDDTIYLPKFIYDGTEYEFEEGMTWENWINSKYNTIHLKIKDGIVKNTYSYSVFYKEVVLGSELIVENRNYIYER